MVLKYPTDMNEGMNDYIMFTAHEYRSNRAFANQNNPGGTEGPAQGEPIIMYMPNSTPGTANQNNWGREDFTGPLNTLRADVGMGVTAAIQNFNPRGDRGQGVSDFVDGFKAQLESAKQQSGPALRQVAMQTVASTIAGKSAQTLTALQRGEIYNPNVELIYQTPQMRSFAFDFIMSPKNAQESQMINDIILEFKKWSAPEEAGTMFKVPCVWKIKYMTGGRENPNMNVFKKSACTSVQVQANPGSDMHQAFDDGMPVTTAMSLTFQEVDIITRGDHENAPNNQGF